MMKTAGDEVRLDGYTVLITGASAGIGKETARDLALRGAKVVMGNRDLAKSERVINKLRDEEGVESLPEDRFVIRQIDLADLESVKSFCEKVRVEFPEIDILINNAGYANFQDPREETKDGHELHFQTNHLGGFLMTHLLIDNLLASKKKPKIIFLSSIAHNFARGNIDFDDLELKRPGAFNGLKSYGLSKLANILTARKLARKYEGKINTYAVHPGSVKTEISRHMDGALAKMILTAVRPFLKTEKRGAFASVHCAVGAETANQSGLYYDSTGRVVKHMNRNVNEENEEKLWSKTCELLNIAW